MIIVKLMGGLGNQLFQYAHGKAVEKDRKEPLLLDISWYKGRTDRLYMLDAFNIDAKVANLFHRFSTKNRIIGDFQSEKYFKNIEDIIRKEFTLKKILSSNPIRDPNAVSIHLRGGDYVKGNRSNFHGVCGPEYYSDAIALIHTHVDSPHFYIFTDDLPWAQNHIKFPEPFTIISKTNSDPCEELVLMSSCKHNIISNSTFSWWAAWLNRNPEKIVIAPRKWFNDATMPSEDIIPSEWIQL
jgi:hypothetical protein